MAVAKKLFKVNFKTIILNFKIATIFSRLWENAKEYRFCSCVFIVGFEQLFVHRRRSYEAVRYFCSDFRFFATVPCVMTNNFNKVVKLMATSSLIECCYNLSSFEDVSCMMFPTRRSLQSAKNILTNLCKLSMTYQ